MNFKIEENYLSCLWNTERIRISKTPKIVSDKSKYFYIYIWNSENQRYYFGTQKVTLHSNKPTTFLLLYAITNEKSVKLMQIDRLLSASKTSPAETRSNNSGWYTFLKSHIPWVSSHTTPNVNRLIRTKINLILIYELR